MPSSNFIDYVKIFCRSGKGGDGVVRFRREKFVPKGGPDGGDGGRGGHVILKGNGQLWTLLHLKYTKHIRADNGRPGESANRTGADGEDVIIEVPLGTVARDAETGKQEAEILEDGQTVIWLPGGKGGLGNTRFKTSTNQAPRTVKPAGPAKEGWKVLELKILADVGLVGFPNAGKSTLLSVVSAAKPRIADYPFTTLVPSLGIVRYKGFRTFVMADMPGIIEGAHRGKGLGHRFLRHIERNAVLLFLVPSDAEDVAGQYRILLDELEKFNPELLEKERVLAVSKSDLATEKERDRISRSLKKKFPSLSFVFISAVSNDGIEKMKGMVWKMLNK